MIEYIRCEVRDAVRRADEIAIFNTSVSGATHDEDAVEVLFSSSYASWRRAVALPEVMETSRLPGRQEYDIALP